MGIQTRELNEREVEPARRRKVADQLPGQAEEVRHRPRGPVTLKQKMRDLEKTIEDCSKELLFHIKEVQILRSEKDTLMEVLKMKTDDVKSTLQSEISRSEDELDRHLKHQTGETGRFDNQIEELKMEKTSLSASSSRCRGGSAIWRGTSGTRTTT